MSGELTLTGEVATAAARMLRTVCGLLDRHRIPYVVDGGTLLGIVRENRLLPWDHDVDITIAESEAARLLALKWRFWLAGCRLSPRRTQVAMPDFAPGTLRVIKVEARRLALMDIFVKKKVGDSYRWIIGTKKQVLKSVPCRFYESRARFRFDGYDYAVPADYEGYLACRYGDWRRVIKDYNCRTDDRAIVRA